MNRTNMVNLAVFLIGGKKIDSVEDTNSKSARIAKVIFEPVADEIFALEYDWKFATARAQLAEISDSPAFGTFDHQYGLPANQVRLICTCDEDGDELEYDYRREVYINAAQAQLQVMLTNQTDVFVKYIVKILDENTWPAWFSKLVIVRIAEYMSEPMKEDTAIARKIEFLWQRSLTEALGANGAEDATVGIDGIDRTDGNVDVIAAQGLNDGILMSINGLRASLKL